MSMLDGTITENRAKDKHPHVSGRVYVRAQDQHGRYWGAEIDKKTNQPAAPVTALFRAPWMPEQVYVVWQHDAGEGRHRVFINYPELKGDRRFQMKEWEARFMDLGAQINGESFDPSKPSLAVLRKAGPKPEAVQIAIMAERGDPWVLGLSDEFPAWAVPFFPEPMDEDDRDLMKLEEQLATATTAASDETTTAPKPRRGRPPRAA